MSEPRLCPLCSGTRAEHFIRTGKCSVEGIEYNVVSCSDCGLLYTQPEPAADEVRSLYDDSYMPYRVPGDSSEGQEPGLLSVAGLIEMFHRTTQWERRLALRGAGPSRILDVGCGAGDFLASLVRLGWEVYGTDWSEAGASRAQDRGIQTHRGDLAVAAFPNDFFDVVTMWHVLEHVPDPLAQLAEVSRILKPDGLLVVEVPNARSATFSLTERKWYYLDVPRHLQHFTPPTLESMLRRSGFTEAARRKLHLWDFTIPFYSFMEWFGLRRALGIEFFSSDFKSASFFSKVAFLCLGGLIAILCVPYVVLTTLLGRGEVITVTAVKKRPDADQNREMPEPLEH